MSRDELILSFDSVINNLVKKYNNHKEDEDLKMICYIKTTKAVDRCLAEGITDPEHIKGRVVVWCKNAILNELRVRNNLYSMDCSDDDLDTVIDTDYSIDLAELRSCLSGTALDVLNLKVQGYDRNTIINKLGISKSTYHNSLNKIKNILGQNA